MVTTVVENQSLDSKKSVTHNHALANNTNYVYTMVLNMTTPNLMPLIISLHRRPSKQKTKQKEEKTKL